MYSNKISLTTMLSHNLTNIARKSGFKLRDMENREVDWRAVGTIDINKLVDMQDLDMLLKVIPKIIEAPMHTVLNTSVLDPSVSSVFRLSQLGLQFLSFCLQFMDHTLFDLKSTMQQLQKHNSMLKKNYKNLEEEHYKTKEQLDRLSSAHVVSPSAATTVHIVNTHDVSSQYTFACLLCTKNFRSNESLEAHVKRKHTTDDQCVSAAPVVTIEHQSSASELADTKATSNDKDVKEQSNLAAVNGAVDGSTINDAKTIVCADCEQRKQLTAAEISIQCNLKTAVDDRSTVVPDTKDAETEWKGDGQSSVSVQTTVDHERNGNYENVIAVMRHEMMGIINQLKTNNDHQATDASANGQNDKVLAQIDSIQERFGQFQEIFSQHQKEFADSFKHLDDRQKFYIDHVNDMLKNVAINAVKVEADSGRTDEMAKEEEELASNGESHRSDDVIVCKPDMPVAQATRTDATVPADGNLTYSEYSTSSEDSSTSDQDEDEDQPRSPATPKEMTKETVCEVLNAKLSQIGIKPTADGVSSSQFVAITDKLAADREKKEKENQSYAMMRNQLNAEMQDIAGKKLKIANDNTKAAKDRSTDNSIMNKLIVNDIDESDIKDKISRAHSVLEAHRESIKTLLNTTVHSPSTMMPPPSISTSTANAGSGEARGRAGTRSNNNTRRVVFVNLDEDS